MDKINHLMAEKNENNKDSQKGQVTTKKNMCRGAILLTKFRLEKSKFVLNLLTLRYFI
jgi:hypothetical protein